MRLLKYKNSLFLSMCTVVLLSLVLYLPLQDFKVFNSPDENTNYLTTKLYAETGELWYSEDYTELDLENYLHPRHFVTHQGRFVPTQFWGLPVMYGPIYSIAGDKAAIIWVITFSLLSFIFFIKLASLLFGEKSRKYAALLFIANLPLLYYLSQPYFNATAAISFFICGLFYLARFSRSTEIRNLFLASLFLSLSIFFRLDYFIFVAIISAITLFNRYRLRLQDYVKPITLSATIIAFFALVPVLALNYNVYGEATLFGTQLLEVASIGREAWKWWQVILPNPVIPDVIVTNVYRLILRLLPLVTLLSVLGVVFYIKQGNFNRYKLLYGVFFIYLLIYYGTSDTWLASDVNYLGFNVSIIRYWLIGYIFLAIMAVKGFLFLSERRRRLLPLLTLTVLVTSVSVFLLDNDYSMSYASHRLDVLQRTAETIQAGIDEKSIIYSDSYGKIFAPLGIKTATWWGFETGYDPIKLVKSMERVNMHTDYSVYFYAPSSYIDVMELNAILKDENLFLESHQGINNLYKLKETRP